MRCRGMICLQQVFGYAWLTLLRCASQSFHIGALLALACLLGASAQPFLPGTGFVPLGK